MNVQTAGHFPLPKKKAKVKNSVIIWTWSVCHHFLVWYVWLYLFALAPSNNSSSLILYCSPWSEPQHVHCASHISLITLLHPQCFASISSTSLLIIQSFFLFYFFVNTSILKQPWRITSVVSEVGHLSLNHTDTCWCTESKK